MFTCICPLLDIVYNCLTEQQVASAHAVPPLNNQRTRQDLQKNVRGGVGGSSSGLRHRALLQRQPNMLLLLPCVRATLQERRKRCEKQSE